MTQKLFLPISLGYIDHWELEHGIKELIANARDTVENDREKIIFSTEHREDGYYDMVIGNKTDGQKLETKHLVMGVSEHRNSSSAIGQFGEGLKLAMVTILRANRQQELRIVNHDEVWTVSVEENPQMGNVKMPVVTIEPCEPQGRVTFHIEGLTKQELVNILDMMWESVSKYQGLEGEDIAIYRADSGLLYVGGIAMGELQPGFAVNTVPYGIEVNRDRKMPNSLEEVDRRLVNLLISQFDFEEGDFGSAKPKENADISLLMDIERRFNLLEDLPLSFQIKADLDCGLIREEEAEFLLKKNKMGRWFDYNLLLEDLKNQTNYGSFEEMVDKGVRLHENWYKHNAIKKRVPEARCVNNIDMIRARRLMREDEAKYGQLFEKLITLPISLKGARAVYSDLFTNMYAVLSEYMSPMEATEKTNELLSDFNQNLL